MVFSANSAVNASFVANFRLRPQGQLRCPYVQGGAVLIAAQRGSCICLENPDTQILCGAVEIQLSRRWNNLILNPSWNHHSTRRIQYFQRYQIAGRIVVQNDTGLVFITLSYRGFGKNHSERIRLAIISDLHLSTLQYFAILLVRYTVTTSGGSRSMSIKTRSRYLRGGLPALIRD